MVEGDANLYRKLGIDADQVDVLAVTQKEIQSAYRKAALKWHPDKNRGDPSAAAKFSEVFLAYETLSAPELRKTYDDRIRAARARKRRFESMDSSRRLMREQLERREQLASQPRDDTWPTVDDTMLKRMKDEIERLRKEAAQTEPEQPKKTSRGRKSVRKDELRDAGPWAEVPGFSEFLNGSSDSFGEFEDAIINGRSPF